MRKLLLAVLCTALSVSSVHASLAPPVKVRPLGELPVVTPNRGNTFAIEIVSPLALPIDDLRIEGDGWTVTAIDAPDVIDLVANEPLVVTFDAVTQNPKEFLRVEFYVGQKPFMQELDYSERGRLMQSQPLPARGYVGTPPPADADGEAPVLNRRERIITVSGRWYTERPDGVDDVIPNARVELWEDDVDPNPDDYIATTYTNSGGAYQFEVDWTNPSETHPDFYVVVWLENSALRVQNVNGGLYGYRTDTEWNYTGTNQYWGNWYPGSGQEETGFIFNRIERGHGLLWTDGDGDNIWDTPKVDVQWDPSSTAGSDYSNGLIRMRNNQGFHEHTILHEYGHHWMAEFGTYPSGRDYCNGQCDASASSCGHCLWCNEDEGYTLTEGFANFVGELLCIGITGIWNTTIFDGHPEARMEFFETTILNSSQCTAPHTVDPLLCEGNFAALLRDISDSNDDNDPNWGGGTDTFFAGYVDVLETFDYRAPVDALDFLAQFVDRYPSTASGLGNAAQNNGYGVGTTRPDMAPFQPGGWADSIVPRNLSNASAGSVPAPSTLNGNAAQTWISSSMINEGGFPTAVETGFSNQIDGVGVFAWGAGKVRNGWYNYGLNAGPFDVKGGRHTVTVLADHDDTVAEGNESDNTDGKQYVWSPQNLSGNQVFARSAPPDRSGGRSSVPAGTTTYDNVDGFRLIGSGDLQGVAIRPDGDADYDLRRYDIASTSATTGFTTASLSSTYGGSSTDYLVFNRRVIGNGSKDLGILNYSGANTGVRIEARTTASAIAHDGQVNVNWASGDVLYVGEVVTPPGVSGWTYLEVEGPSGSGYEVHWLDPGFGEARRSTAALRANEANGTARLTRDTAASTFYPFVLVRDRADGLGAITLTIRTGRVPADLATAVLPGSAAGIVPRDTEDVQVPTGDPVPAPTYLVGDASRTAEFIHWENDSPNPTAQYFVRWERDGAQTVEFDFGTAGANSGILSQVAAPFWVPGGRHTLGVFVDSQDGNAELFEDNNRTASQWVWEPQEIAIGTTIVRSSPPDRSGGLADVPIGETAYQNVDGVRTLEFSPVGDVGQWALVSLSPGAGSDYDPRLYDPSSGPEDGFSTSLVGSGRLDGLTDLCVVNFRNTPKRVFDVGVASYGGSTNYVLRADVSTDLGALPVDRGTTTLGGNVPAEIFEVEMEAGTHAVRLVHDGGDIDWGIVIYPPSTDFAGLTGGTVINANGVGQGEEFDFDAPVAGRYAVVVYKDDSASVAQNGEYSLQMGLAPTSTSDTPSVVATRLVGAAPNPFNPRTSIAFEVARDGHVDVEILDVSGRHVRGLAARSFATGRHQLIWNGTDDGGRSVSSGVYFVRLIADGVQDRAKIVLLK